jgi:hypothetical protein
VPGTSIRHGGETKNVHWQERVRQIPGRLPLLRLLPLLLLRPSFSLVERDVQCDESRKQLSIGQLVNWSIGQLVNWLIVLVTVAVVVDGERFYR